jgi:putative DNA primase/helicase
MTAEEIASALGGRRNGKGWKLHCPAHEDEHPSLDLEEKGDSMLFFCRAGCTQNAVISALRARGLWQEEEKKSRSQIVTAYPYRDELAELLYEVVRYEPKNFRQRRPDGKGGWRWNLDGVRRVPYRLPELLAAKPDRCSSPRGRKTASGSPHSA